MHSLLRIHHMGLGINLDHPFQTLRRMFCVMSPSRKTFLSVQYFSDIVPLFCGRSGLKRLEWPVGNPVPSLPKTFLKPC